MHFAALFVLMLPQLVVVVDVPLFVAVFVVVQVMQLFVVAAVPVVAAVQVTPLVVKFALHFQLIKQQNAKDQSLENLALNHHLTLKQFDFAKCVAVAHTHVVLFY